MSRIRLFALIILLPAAVACSSSGSSGGSYPTQVTDTLGHVFDVSCSGGPCVLTPEDPTLKPLACDSVSSGDTFVLLWSRILTIHTLILSSEVVELNAGEPGHPVKCASDADCTPWNASFGTVNYQYTCSNGICQDTAVSLAAEDVITLCQADIHWPTTCPYVATEPFASRLVEVAATCGPTATTCTVPADCWQVTPAADGGGQPPPVTPADGGAQSAPVDSSVDLGL